MPENCLAAPGFMPGTNQAMCSADNRRLGCKAQQAQVNVGKRAGVDVELRFAQHQARILYWVRF